MGRRRGRRKVRSTDLGNPYVLVVAKAPLVPSQSYVGNSTPIRGNSTHIVPLREIYILYNVHDHNFVSIILRPKLDGESTVIHLQTMPCRDRHLRSCLYYLDKNLSSRCSTEQGNSHNTVVIVLSHRYLQDIERSSECKKIHRCHKTFIIQLGEVTESDNLYEFIGPKFNWFRWPEQEDERVGFWNIFTWHIQS